MAGAWTCARTSVRQRWRAYAVLALLIGLLIGVALTALAGARRTAGAYDRFRAETHARDVSVQVDDPELAARFRDVSALDSVLVGAEVTIFPAFSSLEEGFDLGIVASRGREYGSQIDRPRLLSGRRPSLERADEVLVNEAAARQLGVGADGMVTLETLSPAQLGQDVSARAEGPRLRLHVVGVGRLPDDLLDVQAGLNMIATPAFLARHEGSVGGYPGLAGFRLRDGTSAVGAFEQDVRRIFGPNSELAISNAADESERARDAIGLLTVGFIIVGGAAALVAAAAGVYMLSRQLSVGADTQPILAALGMTRVERTLSTVFVALPVACASALIASATAFSASPLLPTDIARRAEPDAGLAFDALVLGGGALLVAVFVVAIAGVIGWRLAGPRFVEADSRERPVLAARIAGRVRLSPSGVVGMRMSLDPGVGRNRVPVRSALVGLTLGLAGIVAVHTFGANLDRLVETPARYGANWDLTPDLLEQTAARATASPDIDHAAVVHLARVTVEDRAVHGYAMTTLKGEPGFSVLEGRGPVDDSEVALGPDQLDALGVRVGDRVALTRSSVPTRREFVVVGEVLVPGFDEDPFAGGVVLTADALDDVSQSDGFDRAVLSWREGTDADAAMRRFRQEVPGAINVYSVPQPPEDVANLSRVEDLPRVLEGFLVMLCLVTATYALVTTVQRRRRDVAILRCLGFAPRQVFATFAWQSTVMAALALLIGIPIGLALGRSTWANVADGIGVAADALAPTAELAVLVPAVLVLSAALAVGAAVLAARQRAADLLRAH